MRAPYRTTKNSAATTQTTAHAAAIKIAGPIQRHGADGKLNIAHRAAKRLDHTQGRPVFIDGKYRPAIAPFRQIR